MKHTLNLKLTMSRIYLTNHDVHALILEYVPETGKFREIPRQALPRGQSEGRGFYVSVNGAVIGIYASSKGPVCFRNEARFLLSDKGCQVELIEGAEENQFFLRWKGKERISVRYPRVKFKDYDAWSDEEMLDFFLWLSRSVSKDQFFKYYTA